MSSAMDAVSEFDRLMDEAKAQHSEARWQEKLRTLNDALSLCSKNDFPEGEQRTQQVLYQIGGIRRRFGQYDEAITTLQRALQAFRHASPIQMAEIQGELGVVYRHKNEFSKAKEVFHQQYINAYITAVDAEAQLRRAVGNEGMSAYNMSQQSCPCDATLLKSAFNQLHERVDRARSLHARLLKEDIMDTRTKSQYLTSLSAWEKIGMDRLTLCYIADGKPEEAVKQALESAARRTTDDPTIRALSRFFHGNALYHADRQREALEMWQAPDVDTCNPAIALCKEPSKEHASYLCLIVDTIQGPEAAELPGFNALEYLDSYDEQGFSALDYTVLSDTSDGREMEAIVLGAVGAQLRKILDLYYPPLNESEKATKVEEELYSRLRQSQLRQQYRIILQEHIRPKLNQRSPGSIRNVRRVCRELLAKDPATQKMFDNLDYVKYNTFKDLGRLPFSHERLSRRFGSQLYSGDESEYIIFLSYRWIGRLDNRHGQPDDGQNSQWRRMMGAIDEFLAVKDDTIDEDCLSLWLDCACIDQDEIYRRERGIDSLPLAVIQCDAMISLVDEEYYERAWCAVEVMLIRELRQSYGHHEWWTHLLYPGQRVDGLLQIGERDEAVSAEKLKGLGLSNQDDRPKIDFLFRQSKLLGRAKR